MADPAGGRCPPGGRRAGFYQVTVADEAGRVIAACQAVAIRPGA